MVEESETVEQALRVLPSDQLHHEHFNCSRQSLPLFSDLYDCPFLHHSLQLVQIEQTVLFGVVATYHLADLPRVLKFVVISKEAVPELHVRDHSL